MTDSILIQRSEGAVLALELNRPHTKNALSRQLTQLLGASIERAAADAAVKAIILTGNGGAFCSGVDLNDLMGERPEAADGVEEQIDEFHRLIRAIIAAPKPVIAAVDGPAVGYGCDLAAACDVRLVTPRGYFQEKFVAVGLMPGGGGTFFLPRLVGVGRAMEMILGGGPVSGQDAVRIGLANELVPEAMLMTEAIEVAQKLGKGPPLAYAEIKRAVWGSIGGTVDEALAREKQGQLRCLRSSDCREGVLAWSQRRAPVFKGQ